MLSLVILAQNNVDDIENRNQLITESLKEFKINYQITYVTPQNYPKLENIKQVVGKYDKNNVIILGNETNRNSQIYVGLDSARGDSVLVMDIDVNIETIKKVLEKYQDGFENIYVRKKRKGILNIFSKIGASIYNFGIKLLKKLPDLCCDGDVVLLSSESVDTILAYPDDIQELWNTNITPTQKTCVVESLNVHDTKENPVNKSGFTSFGALSLLFLIVSVGALFFYPMFNEWLYSLWMFITIVLWIALCFVICVVLSKQIYNARQTAPIIMDVDNYPLITIFTTYTHKELEDNYKELEQTAKQEDKEAKAKKTGKKEPEQKVEKKQKTASPKKKTENKSTKKKSKTTKTKK